MVQPEDDLIGEEDLLFNVAEPSLAPLDQRLCCRLKAREEIDKGINLWWRRGPTLSHGLLEARDGRPVALEVEMGFVMEGHIHGHQNRAVIQD